MLAISARRRVRDHKIDLSHHSETWTTEQEAELLRVYNARGSIFELQAVTKRTYNATVGRLQLMKLIGYDTEARGYLRFSDRSMLISYSDFKKLDDKAPALISSEAKSMLKDWATGSSIEDLMKTYQLSKSTVGTFLVDRGVAIKLGRNYHNVDKLLKLNQMSFILSEFSEKNSITSPLLHDVEVISESNKDELIHKLLVINSN